MIMINSINFDNSFTRELPPFLFENVQPTPLIQPQLIHTHDLSQYVGFEISQRHLTEWLNGEISLPGEQRIATRYAGHQFGVWAGQLGDGRAISLGEILYEGQRYEIQTKGSGLTPFSRMGDGKAVIRSSVREYLASIAMEGLGIPTTKVLALLTGNDPVYREQVERSALVARVFPTNLRFGHFELCYHFHKKKELKSLIDYTQKYFFKGLTLTEMLESIVTKTASLIALWQSVGFCHGVMNTDNMSILGLTLDYGPFGMMENMNLHHICNSSDHQGRYSYSNQPAVAFWNLEKFLICFLDFVPKAQLESILHLFPRIFEREQSLLFKKKLGLTHCHGEHSDFIGDTLKMMHDCQLDFTFFFRSLSVDDIFDENHFLSLFDSTFYDKIKKWRKNYINILQHEKPNQVQMRRSNPKFILRNYIAQEVIEDVESGKDDLLKKWINVFKTPFDEHEEIDLSYAKETPDDKKNIIVSCSS